MNIRKYPLPKTRDPFVNTPITAAGRDPETGAERFWISTWNANGMTGALFDTAGKIRTYQFTHGKGYAGCGAYSAVYVGDELLWLISDTAYILRLHLTTGEVEEFATGAYGNGLVFAGAQYDEPTGKLLIFANAYIASGSSKMAVQGVTFDVRNLCTVTRYENLEGATSVRGGFPNGDGTYTICSVTGRQALWRWDPKDDSLTLICETDDHPMHDTLRTTWGELGHYIPHVGWCDGYTIRKEQMPDTERLWFGRYENYSYGTSGGCVWRWDMCTGKVDKFTDEDTALCDYGTGALLEDGSLIIVNLYGLIRIYAPDGKLMMSKWIDADVYGGVDCLIATDDGKVIGTPFITQRFWIYDETTGCGWDAGKAAPDAGQITALRNVGGKIYMTSYGSGTMVAYDPTKGAGYPENPYLVSRTIVGMRPMMLETDGKCLYFASNHHYGHAGCILTKYDPETDKSLYRDDPLQDEAIWSLYCGSGVLWAGTTWKSDCHSAHEPRRDSFLMKLDPDTLDVLACYEAPAGTDVVSVWGETTGGLLVTFENDESYQFVCFDPAKETFTVLGDVPMGIGKLLRTGRCGEYITLRNGKIERWMISCDSIACEETILDAPGLYQIGMDQANGALTLCAAAPKDLYVIRDF